MSYLELLEAIALLAIAALISAVVRRRRNWLKVPAALLIAACLVFGAGLVLSFFLSHTMCGEYDFPSTASPDEAYLARVREFDCGATTPFTSYVEVRARSSGLGRLGLSHWSTVFRIEDDPRLVSVSWTGPRVLTIRHRAPDRRGDLFRCDARWNDVHITCVRYVPDETTPLGAMPKVNRWLW